MEMGLLLHLENKPIPMKITFGLLSLCAASALSAQQADFTVYFDKASSRPHEADVAALQVWSAVHARCNDRPVLLRGHTDAEGEASYNHALSISRNEAVKALLTEAGWKDVRLQPFGESWLVSAGEEDRARGIDRRVEIVFAETGEEQFALAQQLSAPEVFHGDPQVELCITTEKGTRVVIPAGVLQDGEGRPATTARIEVRDFYSKSECISALLTTSCGDQRLESGGMAEIRAFDGNEALTLAPGAVFSVDFAGPAAQLEGMQLFNGEVQDGWMNWVPVEPVGVTVSPAARDFGSYPELVRMINAGNTYNTDFFVTDSLISGWNQEKLRCMNTTKDVLSGMFTANKFGFINCDRFIKRDKESLRDICVDIGEDTPAGRSFLVFANSNSILRGAWNGECGLSSAVWKGVPRDEPMTVIVQRAAGEGEMLFGHVEIGENDNYRLKLRPSSEEEMEAFISGLSD